MIARYPEPAAQNLADAEIGIAIGAISIRMIPREPYQPAMAGGPECGLRHPGLMPLWPVTDGS